MRLYFQQFNVNFFQKWRFPLKFFPGVSRKSFETSDGIFDTFRQHLICFVRGVLRTTKIRKDSHDNTHLKLVSVTYRQNGRPETLYLSVGYKFCFAN